MAKKSGIHIKKSKQGSLHSAVGVKQDDKIPASKLAIKASDSPALKKKKQFAINAAKWKHQAGGYDEAGQALHDEQLYNPVEEGLEGGPGAPDYSGLQAQPIDSQVIRPTFDPINVAGSVPDPNTLQSQSHPQPQGRGWRATGRDVMGYVNAGAGLVTNIANSINDKNMRQDEYRRLIRSQVNYQPNMESEGLNNVPAYTKYGGKLVMKKMGGPIAHGEPVGVVQFKASEGYHDDEMDRGFRNKAFYDGGMEYEGGEPFMFQAGGSVSADKAKEILRDGTAQGHTLTEKQRKYFGWIAGGSKQAGGGDIQPRYNFPNYVEPNATDSATYKKDFYDILYGNPGALEKLQAMNNAPNGIPFQKSSAVIDQVPTSKELAYKDAEQQIMKNKLKKQAGGRIFTPDDNYQGYTSANQGSGRVFTPKGQTGVTAPPNPNRVNPPAQDPNDPSGRYAANATYQYFKDQLNQKLRDKNPEAYDQYQAGFNDIQDQVKQGKLPVTQQIAARQKYVSDSQYNEALSNDEVRNTLGDKYQTYLNSLQAVNNDNIAAGQKPLYGDIEGDVDVTQQKYGRRFAAVTTNPTNEITRYAAGPNGVSIPASKQVINYKYNPNTNSVTNSSNTVQLDAQGNPINPNASSPSLDAKAKSIQDAIRARQAANRAANGQGAVTQQQAGGYGRVKKQAGGYSVGQEVELTAAQIADLKKQGYKIENV